jgi:hypothetical protein
VFGGYIVAKFGFRQKFSAGWESFFFGLGWVLVACAPLAFLATTYGATTRVLYVPSVGYAIMVGALAHLFFHFIFNAFLEARFVAGLLILSGILVVISPSIYQANVFVQRQYSPSDSNTLRFDQKVYAEWKGKIPDRHIVYLEEKLKKAGKL